MPPRGWMWCRCRSLPNPHCSCSPGQNCSTTATICPPAPTARFTFSPTAPAPGRQVVFDTAGTTTAQGQTIVNYAWNFGDGTPITNDPNRTIAHTFTLAGTYTVNLVVTDSAGRTGSTSAQIIVGP